MIRTSIAKPPRRNFDQFRRGGIQKLERRALVATDRAAAAALRDIRVGMQGAKLGRLGNAISSGSDLRKGGKVQRVGANGFRTSGWVFVRSRSERALGSIEAYTEGAEISPVRGRWLWIAGDDIPNRVGKYRMTPDRYRKGGFEQKIGPLFQIRSINGYPLLVVKNVGVSAAGKSRSAKNFKRNGQPRKGQRAKELLVAFIGIPRTSRAARINARKLIQAQAAALAAAIIGGF
jgi:hypothetical protein